MKSILSIALLAALFFFHGTLPARAENDGLTPATHMWVMTGNALIFVPARTLGQCFMLVQQASSINSSTGECYNDGQLLKKIRCTKSVKKDAEARCEME